jgi:hypothetical protein
MQSLQDQLGPRGFTNVDRIPEHRLGVKVSSTISAGQNEWHKHCAQHFGDRGDPFSCKVNIENGGVWPLYPQQSQGRTDVWCRAQHLVAGTPQRDIELHRDKELVFND